MAGGLTIEMLCENSLKTHPAIVVRSGNADSGPFARLHVKASSVYSIASAVVARPGADMQHMANVPYPFEAVIRRYFDRQVPNGKCKEASSGN